MGKLSNSLLSGSYGRTGRLVVANVGGTEILRHRPRKQGQTTNPRQLLVQQRMREAYSFLTSYKHFATKYFGRKIGMKSPYNMAMANLLNAFELDYTLMQVVPVYGDIGFARGSRTQAIATGLTSAAANSFTLQWMDNSGGNPVLQTDRAQILYAAEGENTSVFMENVATRLEGTFTAPLTPDWSGKTVHVWLAFLADDDSAVSNSIYAGSVVVS